jgi:ketosteroid isomerase-like protein
MQSSKSFLTIVFFCGIINCMEAQTDSEKVISILQEQQTCWNNGDINCFMQHYWNNDSLSFVGKYGIQYGWNKTLENYLKSYPDKDAMGELVFDIVKVDQFSQNCIYILGKWNLKRKIDNPKGYFTIIFKKINDQWLIVSDHSS